MDVAGGKKWILFYTFFVVAMLVFGYSITMRQKVTAGSFIDEQASCHL